LAHEVAVAATAASSATNDANAARLSIGREANAPAIADCRSAEAAIDAREHEGVALFVTTRAALKAWSSSHTKLLTAVRERKPVNIQSLLAASEDVRTLITKWRDI